MARPSTALAAAATPLQPNATLQASARRIEIGNPDDLRWLQKHRQKWQNEAWRYNDTLGEVNFAHRYIGNMLSRLRLYPAWKADPQSDPVPMDPNEKPDDAPPDWEQMCEAAQLELARLAGSFGSFGHLLGPAGWNVALVGECYLVALPDPDEPEGERFEILSIDELHVVDAERGDLRIRQDESDREGEPIDAGQFFMRIWRRHPRWRNRADAPMASLLEICEELQLLGQAIRASARSRLNAGILKLPSQLFFGPSSATTGSSDGSAEPFMNDLETALSTPIIDPDAPTANVPLLLRGDKDALAGVEHLLLARPIEEQQLKERQELRTRLATGLDLPNEILLGMTDANHWTAWQVDEQTYKAHLEPLAALLAQAISSGFFQPALIAQGFLDRRALVGHDPQDLIGDENEFVQATEMHKELVVSDAYFRRVGGASEDDAPDEEELQRRIEIKRPLRFPNVPTENAPVNPEPGTEPSQTGEGTGPGAPPSGNGKEPAPAVPASAAPVVALTAAIARQRNLDTLAARLAEIDRNLRLRLQPRAEAELRRKLEMAGAKIKRRAGQYKPIAARLAGHPTGDFAYIIGREQLGSWGINDQDLVDDNDRFEEFAVIYAAWATAAYRASRAAMARTLRPQILDEVAVVTEADTTAIAAGWNVLLDGLKGAIQERLFEPHPSAPAVGEFDAFATVSPGLIRDSLSVAGGAVGTAPDVMGGPSGGIATGDAANDMLSTLYGVTAGGGRWLYGDPSSRTRPFEPHQELDGQNFTDWDDEILTNTEGWPDTDFFYPGDHDTCQCDYIPALEAGE